LNKSLRSFLNDLLGEIKGDVISVVLFGSAATGEWKRGKSDIDLFIVVKNNRKKRLMKKLYPLILKLDRRYRLNLAEVCFGFKGNPFLKVFLKFVNYFLYRAPYYVFSEKQLVLDKLTIKDWKVKLLSILGSINIFWWNLKRNGKVIYGENILSQIRVGKITAFEKKKQLFFHFILGLLEILVSMREGKHQLRKVLIYNREWII
jgi:predicted nucleotidyltransferase